MPPESQVLKAIGFVLYFFNKTLYILAPEQVPVFVLDYLIQKSNESTYATTGYNIFNARLGRIMVDR